MKKISKKLIPLGILAIFPLNAFALSDIQWNSHQTAIEFLASQGVVKGYDSGPYAGKFMPNKSVSFAEALAISMRSGDKSSRLETPQGWEHWSAPLLRLYNAEDKQTERTYKDHNAPINRDVALYLILRQAGVHFEKETVNAGFSDVKSTSMFAPYIAFAKWAGYTRGYTDGPKAGQFGANEALTRWELSTFTYKILKSEGGTTAVKAKFDEYRAFKWLEKNNGVYSDLASLTSGIGAVYGRESSVTAAAVTLVQSGKFSYKYKTVSSGTTVSTPSSGWSTGGQYTHWTNDKWEAVDKYGYSEQGYANIRDRERYNSIVGNVELARKEWVSDMDFLRMIENRYWKNSQTYKDTKYFIETGRTDFPN